MRTLPSKLETLIEQEVDPRESEAWFLNLPEERRAESTREWKNELRRLAELGLRERKLQWRDSLQMGVLLVVADHYTHLGTTTTAMANFALGCLLGWLASRFDLERLATPLLIVPSWIALQVGALRHLSIYHFFIVFPLSAVIAYGAARRSERAFE